MSVTPTTLRAAPHFSLAEMFRWSLALAFWYAFCGIVPTTIIGAIAGVVAMAALVAARYYWVRGPRVPARLEWSYFFFVFSVAVFVSFASFATLLLVPDVNLFLHPAMARQESEFVTAWARLCSIIWGYFAAYAVASTMSLILALSNFPVGPMATRLVWINLPGLLLGVIMIALFLIFRLPEILTSAS